MATGTLFLQAALNGNRDHPALPRTPEELAQEARAAVNAGARSLHLHPYDEHGRETLAAGPCVAALRDVVDPDLQARAATWYAFDWGVWVLGLTAGIALLTALARPVTNRTA